MVSRRKHKSKLWCNNIRHDGFKRRATLQGYRSRAVYKLQEIDRIDRLIVNGMRVLELGAAPGGWTQYLAAKVGSSGTIVAVDVLPMKPLENVRFLRGDFTDKAFQREFISALGGRADLVISDMAPNITGIREVDQANVLDLLEVTLHVSAAVLRTGGNLLMKVFEGPELKDFRTRCDQMYKQVLVRKPSASRPKSREYYLLAKSLLHTQSRIG